MIPARLYDVHCPDCGKLLFKALGPFDVEIMCNSSVCKAQSRALDDMQYRHKRLTWPNPATRRSRTVDEQR
jgi:uncharacterized Zn finger protein (UPF0148 family)